MVIYTEQDIDILPIPIDARFRDLTGRESGKIQVLGFAGKTRTRQSLWWCRCECGNICKPSSTSAQKMYSCGCQRHITRRTHGKSHSPEHRAYYHARNRCQNPNDTSYERYGQRGIEFRFESFEEFYAEVGDRPSDNHSIERIDNNKHYERGNLKWATPTEQGQNKSNNNIVTFNGKTQCVAEWERELGCRRSLIYGRIRIGWSPERAILTPEPPPRNKRQTTSI